MIPIIWRADSFRIYNTTVLQDSPTYSAYSKDGPSGILTPRKSERIDYQQGVKTCEN